MELYESPKHINGVNLADYYADRRSYNSVVYVHKKSLEKPKTEKKEEKVKKEKKSKKKSKCDKCEQCTDLDYNPSLAQNLELNSNLLAQSLQYARAMVPLVIPPSGIVSPVYYTIKASKKKDKKKPKDDVSAHTLTLKKEKSKKVVETYRHQGGKESLSVKETVTSYSHSSQSDTFNEIQLINPSLSCSFSEISDDKQARRGKRDKQKPDSQKLVPSESFEALATEFLNTSGDTKIKIHLMNEAEKHLFSENIRGPVLNAIRECIAEINNQKTDVDREVATVQKYVKCNTVKLDNVMEQLSRIEQKFDEYINKEKNKLDHLSNIRTEFRKQIENSKLLKQKSPKEQTCKASTLEQLGEDILELTEKQPMPGLELKDESSGDDCFPRPTLSARKRAKAQSNVLQLLRGEDKDSRHVSGDGDEDAPTNSSLAQAIKPSRGNRVPARFCWTDVTKKPSE